MKFPFVPWSHSNVTIAEVYMMLYINYDVTPPFTSSSWIGFRNLICWTFFFLLTLWHTVRYFFFLRYCYKFDTEEFFELLSTHPAAHQFLWRQCLFFHTKRSKKHGVELFTGMNLFDVVEYVNFISNNRTEGVVETDTFDLTCEQK